MLLRPGRVGGVGNTRRNLGPAPAVQPLRIATAPNYIAVAQASAVGATRKFISRRPVYIGSGGASELVASFANTYTGRTTQSGNDLTIKSLYLEKGDGSASVQITFDGGATEKVVPWAATDVNADRILPAAFGMETFPGNSLWWERIVYEVPLTTDGYPRSVPIRTYAGQTAYKCDPATFPALSASGTGLLDGTGLTAIAVDTKVWGAIWLGRGLTAIRSFMCRGDSWTRDSDQEAATTIFPLRLFSDVFERALVNEAGTIIEPFLNTGVYGSGITPYTAANDASRGYYKYATDMFDELAYNDAGSGFAAIQTALTALWAEYKAQNPSVRIWRTKVLYATTSTDAWVTEENQTIQAVALPGGSIYQANDWFDTKVADGTIHGVIPIGRLRGRTSFYKWRVNDGVANWAISSNHPAPSTGVRIAAAEIRTYLLPNASAAPATPVLTTARSDTTITVTWTQGGQPASDHLVEISPAGAGTWTALHTYDDVRAHCFTGLTASTSYDIRITAINHKGSSAAATATVATVAAPACLLDTLTAPATAAYSSRRLRAAYTGPAARVVRTSDRIEIDIGFNATGDLDTTWLLAWANGSTVRIKRKYDQSGNGYHQSPVYTSFSIERFPFLAVNGVLSTINGKPVEELTITEYYNLTTLTSIPTVRTVNSVVKPTSFAAARNILGTTLTGGYAFRFFTDGRSRLEKQGTSTLGSSTGATAAGALVQISCSWDSANMLFRRNGAADGSAASATTFSGAGVACLGNGSAGSAANYFLGQIPEVIVHDGALLSNSDRDVIEAGRSYWGIG